ncbi:gasdermin-E-like [Myxocyprinus asiaticus]|uniref:gasdermin-E-like n=1 Tax=Myxocyprinus asiaticus TaxID=70543 RepID=UPI0022238688|nr:gasdermin-E-like [Myxocyprinus asiaticus]
MFEKATKKLVQQTDPHGALIAASSLNDSKKLKPLAVVLKSQKVWFWQRTKYRPTPFTLQDLLLGKAIKPVLEETDFVKYQGMYTDSVSGYAKVGGGGVAMSATGQGTFKLSLSRASLRKEDVNIQRLLMDSRGRKVDLCHSLIQQSMKRKMGFTLLKERIFTTCECTISCTGLEEGSCHGILGISFAEMSMKGSGKLNSKIAIEIPPDTVMAYSVIEMSLNSDGYFDLCTEPSGIEEDDISQNPFPGYTEVDGLLKQEIQEGSPLSTLKKALADAQTRFCSLDDLSDECHSSLLILLRQILLDRSVLSALMDRLEVLSSDEAPCFFKDELSEEQSQIISTFLDLLKCEPFDKGGLTTTSMALSNQNGSQLSTADYNDFPFASEMYGSSQNGCHTAVFHPNGSSSKATKQSTQVLIAMHMLISGIEELTDDGLDLLGHFCTSEGLRSLKDLTNLLTANCRPLCKDIIPVFLQKEDEFHRVEELFKSCNVLLRKKDNILSAEVSSGEGFLPLVLCIAIHGLASLVRFSDGGCVKMENV